jgi:aspartyl protease family protein
MGEDAPRTLYLVLLLMLVAGSLIGMRLPMGKVLKMALAWIGIFAAMFVIFAFRDDFSALGARLKSEATGAPIESGTETRIPMAEDGHFWLDVKINGANVPMLVDSGATMTTIGRTAAERAGIPTDGSRDQIVQTANGTIGVSRARAERIQVGSIERRDLAVHVADRDDLNVLGMNFLSSLERWSVEGRWLILVP